MTANARARWRTRLAELRCVVGNRHVWEKLEARIDRIPFSGCWAWLGPTNGAGKYGRGGYGVITDGGRNLYAHRVAFESHYGPIPSGQMVCHTCDVRCCVNPAHLFLSDARGNHEDKVRKGRSRSPGAPGDRNATRKYPGLTRGERNGRSVLSAADVAVIRAAHAAGTQQRVLAKQYRVGQSQISRICRGEHWR